MKRVLWELNPFDKVGPVTNEKLNQKCVIQNMLMTFLKLIRIK